MTNLNDPQIRTEFWQAMNAAKDSEDMSFKPSEIKDTAEFGQKLLHEIPKVFSMADLPIWSEAYAPAFNFLIEHALKLDDNSKFKQAVLEGLQPVINSAIDNSNAVCNKEYKNSLPLFQKLAQDPIGKAMLKEAFAQNIGSDRYGALRADRAIFLSHFIDLLPSATLKIVESVAGKNKKVAEVLEREKEMTMPFPFKGRAAGNLMNATSFVYAQHNYVSQP